LYQEHSENIIISSHGVRRPTTKSVARDPFCSRPSSRDALRPRLPCAVNCDRCKKPIVAADARYKPTYDPEAFGV
jgi:hypothetical protein